MSDSGGVAGQVLGSMIDAGRTYSLHGYHEEMEFRREGAEELLDALSREARAILAENPEPFGFDEHAAYERGMRAGVLEMAHRLGLDLESEDAE